MNRRLVISLLCIVLLTLGACKTAPRFTFQEIEKDLSTRIDQMQKLLDKEHELTLELQELTLRHIEKHETKPDFSDLKVEDHEARFGIGYPYALELELYSPSQIERLDAWQADVDTLGEKLSGVFELEAQIKILNKRLKSESGSESQP